MVLAISCQARDHRPFIVRNVVFTFPRDGPEDTTVTDTDRLSAGSRWGHQGVWLMQVRGVKHGYVSTSRPPLRCEGIE